VRGSPSFDLSLLDSGDRRSLKKIFKLRKNAKNKKNQILIHHSVFFGVVGTTLYNERGSARGRGATASQLATAGRLKKANDVLDAFESERFLHFFHLLQEHRASKRVGRIHQFARAKRRDKLVRYSTQLSLTAASIAGGGARSALGFVRGSLVAPVDQLAGFAAVPHLGVVEVQAPAAQLARLRSSATHARLDRVEIAQQGFSSGYGFIIFIRLLLGHRNRFQMFHSEGHVPIKRADGHILIESHQVDLADDALRGFAALLSRLCPPLHRHGEVLFKSVRADAITVPNVTLRGLNSRTHFEVHIEYFSRTEHLSMGHFTHMFFWYMLLARLAEVERGCQYNIPSPSLKLGVHRLCYDFCQSDLQSALNKYSYAVSKEMTVINAS
jgi:hypothetical protein